MVEPPHHSSHPSDRGGEGGGREGAEVEREGGRTRDVEREGGRR